MKIIVFGWCDFKPISTKVSKIYLFNMSCALFYPEPRRRMKNSLKATMKNSLPCLCKQAQKSVKMWENTISIYYRYKICCSSRVIWCPIVSITSIRFSLLISTKPRNTDFQIQPAGTDFLWVRQIPQLRLIVRKDLNAWLDDATAPEEEKRFLSLPSHLLPPFFAFLLVNKYWTNT